MVNQNLLDTCAAPLEWNNIFDFTFVSLQTLVQPGNQPHVKVMELWWWWRGGTLVRKRREMNEAWAVKPPSYTSLKKPRPNCLLNPLRTGPTQGGLTDPRGPRSGPARPADRAQRWTLRCIASTRGSGRSQVWLYARLWPCPMGGLSFSWGRKFGGTLCNFSCKPNDQCDTDEVSVRTFCFRRLSPRHS